MSLSKAESRKEWYNKNKQLALEYNRKRYALNPEIRKAQNIASAIRHKQVREAWLFIIKALGMDECFRCGYNKCFSAIDFHHVNPKEKKIEIGFLFHRALTEENLKELEKVVPLCKNCHCEVQEEMKMEGSRHE
jgi:hypothetical protein